jgi:ribose transport system substrate-binding protein
MISPRRGALIAASAGLLVTAAACSSSASSASSAPATGSAASSASSAASSASSSTSAAATKQLSLAYANITNANASLAGVSQLISSAAKTIGDSVTLYDNNSDPGTATSVAQLMVNAKPDVILDWSPAPQIGASLSAIFTRASIPCIAVDIQIGSCPWFYPDNTTLGTETGQALAAIMKAKGWNGSNTTFVIAQNSTVGDQNNALERSGYLAVAHALTGFPTPALTAITASTTTLSTSAVQIDTGDEIDTAFTAMKNELQTIPASRNIVVYGITDESTLGAWRALSGSGRTNVLLGGNGGDPTGLTQLRTNTHWVVESSPFVPNWGEYLMAMAHALAAGTKVPADTPSPMAVLTKANISQYYAAGSTTVKKLPPLSAQDQYLVGTGVLQKFGNVSGLG